MTRWVSHRCDNLVETIDFADTVWDEFRDDVEVLVSRRPGDG